jgi:hypothetical protein
MIWYRLIKNTILYPVIIKNNNVINGLYILLYIKFIVFFVMIVFTRIS